MDQLPGLRGVLLPGVPHGGRLHLLPRRADAPAHPLPLQQHPQRRRRPVLLPQRRRRRVDPVVDAGQGRAGLLRGPPRHGLHADHRVARGPDGLGAVLRPARAQRRGPAGDADQRHRRRQVRRAVLVPGVRPVERPRRPDQLPAQPVAGRGGGRARRAARVGDLPPHRVPGAPRPLRGVRGEHPRGGLRHRPRHLRGGLQLARRGRRPAGRAGSELGGLRLVPDRLAPPGRRPGAGGVPQLHVRPGLHREPAGGQVGARRRGCRRPRGPGGREVPGARAARRVRHRGPDPTPSSPR